jgi:hypothetical protein
MPQIVPFIEPTDDRLQTLRLVVDPTLIPRFYPILQAGFFVKVRTGESVGQLLRGQWGLSEDYVRERISTIFLDGKPLDDVDSATVREGSTLALSSAMPGLVGATMRRKGFYASFRGSITYKEEAQHPPEKDGFFRVKLFNLLMEELGTLLLGKGIYVPSSEIREFLANQSDLFFAGCREIVLDGQSMEVSPLRETGWSERREWVQLTVCASQ